jgi:VWFA-related protein
VDLVPLDVSVWDKDGRPVKGLTADKFTLLENEKPREIVTFSAVDIPEPPAPTAPWMRDAAVDVATNDITDKRLFLILVDDASFGSATLMPSFLEKVKETARTVIRHLGPSDLAAVVFTGDNRRSQDFTVDHARLLAAVNQMTGVTMPTAPPPRGTVLRAQTPGFPGDKLAAAADLSLADIYSVTVLERAVESLLRAPGRRKALVDITSFSMNWIGPTHLLSRTEAMFEKAQRAGVNVYTMGPKPVIDRDYWEGTWFRRVARETGGQWYGEILEPGAAEQAVTKIFQANSSYYILGYSSEDLKKFHFVKVLVDVPGVTVRAREKHYWPEPEKPATGPPPPPLTKSIAGVLPDADIPMRATAAAFAAIEIDGADATVAVITNVRVTPAGAVPSSLETLAFSTRAFTAEGSPRGEVFSDPAVRHVGRDVDAEVFSQMRIEKPGLYELRMAAHRTAVDVNGSVYLTVDVPDFAKLPVSLSGVVLSTSPWPVFGLKDEFATLIPVKPTIDREFPRGQRVRAFVRVYQGGKGKLADLSVRVRIVDDHDRAVLDRAEALPPAKFTVGRGADLIVDLPTMTLAPGPYLLTFDTAIGKAAARREVRFSVR